MIKPNQITYRVNILLNTTISGNFDVTKINNICIVYLYIYILYFIYFDLYLNQRCMILITTYVLLVESLGYYNNIVDKYRRHAYYYHVGYVHAQAYIAYNIIMI